MDYGPIASRLLRVVLRRTECTSESLAAHMRDEYGVEIDSSLIRKWAQPDGRYHLPAAVLPALAEHSGRPDLVFGPLLPHGWRIAREEAAAREPSGDEEADALAAAAKVTAALVAGDASDELLERAAAALRALLDARATATPIPAPVRVAR
jgi:hypothetical protein